MRNASIFRALLLALLLTVLTVPALAASCVQCGGETEGDEYLCTACLVKLLKDEAPANLTFKRVYQDYWGNVRVQWTDSEGNAPYRVIYELAEEAPKAFGWTDAADLTVTHHTLRRLAPGVSYIITVADCKGNIIKYEYEPVPPAVNDRIGAGFTLATQRHTASAGVQKVSFTLAELSSGNVHTLAVQPSYARLAYGYLYQFHLTVTAPNGFTDVIYSGNLDLGPGLTYLDEWSRIPVDDYFGYLTRYYGGIPTGEYLVTLYFNGEAIGCEGFTVAP